MEELFYIIKTLTSILVVIVPLFLIVAYVTYSERKIIGFMQSRMGPMRVGPSGLLQPIADVLKLVSKEIIIPTSANKGIFLTAPMLMLIPSLLVWSVIPLSEYFIISNINAGLLFILALTSLSVYGVILAGWASNSKYAFLGSMRSAAQIIAYEIAMGFALVGVLMLSGSLNLQNIIYAQSGSLFNWYWLPLFPLFLIYFIAGVAETPEWGGASLAYMVTSEDTKTRGEFYTAPPGSSKYGNDAFGREFAVATISKEAQDDAKAIKLWDLSEKLVGIKA